MAHNLDFQTGKAGMAYTGETPWHELGQQLTPGAPLETWQHEAGLDWEALTAPVQFQRPLVGLDGQPIQAMEKDKGHKVIFRSDTGKVLSVMGSKYRPVQPAEVIGFYRDLTEKHGYELETAGSIADGRKIWALANTNAVTQLRGGDKVRGYLLLATSFDGTMSTQARFTAVRVVCNNTLSFATEEGKADVVIPHCSVFDADKVKEKLQIGDAFARFHERASAMSQRIVGQNESVQFFLDVYYGLDTPEKVAAFREVEGNDKRAEKLMARLTTALFNSPGAHLESAKGMLWGLVNAVTYDVDHQLPSRTSESRFNKAHFGIGEAIKNRAMAKACAMI